MTRALNETNQTYLKERPTIVSHYIPQPRYSKEHQEQSAREGRPLFTLDIYTRKGKRVTATGVLGDAAIDEMIARLQRVKDGPAE